MTCGSLFSGIGGIDLGFQRAGFEIAWQVEIDRAARSVLSLHWPGVLKFEDVCKVGKKQLSKVDVIAFGSPCQDFSVAGQRAGISGKRSGLFFEAIRIVRQLRPAFAVWENVPGAFSSDRGRGFTAVLSAFLKCGARDIAWRVLDAQYLGVAQRRKRVFLVADFRGQRAGQILFESACMCGHPTTRGKEREGVASTLRGRIEVSGTITGNGDAQSGFKDENEIIVAPNLRASGVGTERAGDTRGQDCLVVGSVSAKWAKGTGRPAGDECYNLVAHSLRGEGSDASEDGTGRGTPIVPFVFQTRIARNGRGQPKETVDALTSSEGGSHADSKPHVATEQGVRRLTPRECERLQGLPDDWTRHTADGKEQKDGPRYKQIGNGVAVPVLEWIANRIIEASK